MGNLNKVTIPLQNRREGTLCQCPAEPWGSRGRNPAGQLHALRRHRLPAPRAVAGRGKAALTTRTGGGAPVPPVPCGHRPSPARPAAPLVGYGELRPPAAGLGRAPTSLPLRRSPPRLLQALPLAANKRMAQYE